MMMKATLYFLAAATVAQSAALVNRQQVSLCGKYSYWADNGYELINNLWGGASVPSASQCTYLDGSSANGLQWHTTWTWQGAPNHVKSFSHAGRQVQRGRKMNSIEKMPTSATWDYDNDKIRANVAYDLFTAADPNHPNSSGDYEVMIWPARYDIVDPLGSIIGPVNIAGRVWDLWIGYNGGMKVHSFIVPSPSVPIKSFNGDVKTFFDYIQRHHQFPADSQNLITFQMGTEAFTGGPTTLTVKQFSAEVI